MIDKNRYQATKPRFRDYFQPRYWPAWLVVVMFRLFAFLPQWVVWHAGAVIGEIGFHVHRTTTIKINLDWCFPEMSECERRQLRRRYYHYVGRSFLGLGLAWFASPARMRRLVHIKGREHLERVRENKQGVLFVVPHFLSLEVGGIFSSLEYGDYIGLYRKPRNPLFHESLRYCMTRFGGKAIERYENMKSLIKAMRDGKIIHYSPDQDPDRAEDDFVFAPFFGVPAATYTALPKLARLGKAAVIPCYTYMLPGGGGYEIEILPPLENFPTGDDQKDAKRLNRVIEEAVRRIPEQYLWSYRRFDTRPDNAPSPYIRK